MAMSGGIDSSVAAIMLTEQGYGLIGATYRTFDSISESCMAKEKGCCSVDSIFEARRMAKEMGFPHHILDLRQHFKDTVIADFTSEYMRGRTPNPCVVCNSNIKWGELHRFALEHDCSLIATGHYARIGKTDEGRYFLRRGVDENKDQTYFLWKLTQENLASTLFPLGGLTKQEVRAIAAAHGYEKLSRKSESQEICFIPDNDYRSFLRNNVPDYDMLMKPGKFLDVNGRVLGIHQGFANYTIGQRKGLGIALGSPAYVVRIDVENNAVILGDRDDLKAKSCRAEGVNMMKQADFDDGIIVMAKIRYKSQPGPARLFHETNGVVRIEFLEPMESVTPGQSVLFYVGDNYADVLGGAILSGVSR